MELIKTKFPLKGIAESRIGGRSENQDNYGFCDTAIGAVVVVCDGMGGMQGGRVASMIAVKSILEFIASVPKDADPGDALNNAIRKAHADVIQTGHDNPELYGMGTTVTAVIFSKECATVAHVGDSRIYQLRGRSKVFRTFDHSMVFEMVRNGVLSEEQARLSDQSNVILKALGIYGEVVPDICKLPYRKGDRFILCTDGFWGSMPEKPFLAGLAVKEVGHVLERTANLVEEIGRKKGGSYDNLTAAIVEVQCNSQMKAPSKHFVKWMVIAVAALVVIGVFLYVLQTRPDSGTTEKKMDMQENIGGPKADVSLSEAEESGADPDRSVAPAAGNTAEEKADFAEQTDGEVRPSTGSESQMDAAKDPRLFAMPKAESQEKEEGNKK